MATEDILIRYRADVSQLETDINKVIKQQDELIKATNENTTATNKAVTSQQLAAKKRAELLELEVQKLKKIQEAQKLAFDPVQIQKYNNQIAESTKRIELLEGKSQQAANSITNAFKGAAAALAAAFSVQAISSFAQTSVNAFVEAEKASGRLRSNIVTLGGEGEAAFEAINKQADELAKKTLFDDENIRDAASQLAAFGFSAEEIQKVIPGILDFAQAFNVDLATAINQVGPALDGVAGKLSKYGLNVSESASRTENLNSVLQFTAQYAGQASAATETLAGQLTQKQKEIEELQESIGEKLVPAYLALGKAQLSIVNFFERLSTVIAENAGFFKALIPLLITYLGVVTRAAQISAAAAIAEKAKAVATGLSAAATKTAAFFTNLYTVATSKNTVATKAQTVATEVATAAQKGLNNAIKSNPLGLLLGVLSAVVLAYQAFADSADEVTESTQKQKENIEELNKISADYNKQLAVEKNELDRLFNSVKQYNTGSRERQNILNEINQKYGLTLKNLDDEKKFVEQLDAAYKALLPTIEAKFRLEAGEQRFKKAIEQQFDAAEALKNAELDRAKALSEVDKAQQKANKSAKAGALQSGIGGTGNLASEANFAQQRLDINEKYNIDKLKADKKAADERLQLERDNYTGLQATADAAGKNLNKANQKLNTDRNNDAKKAAEEAAKIEADRQKAIADTFAKYADEFLKLRNEADQQLQDIEFTITLNTKGLSPAIEQFQKTAATNLEAAIKQLQTQIDANPLAFDALTDDQKQALIINQFKSFVGQIDQAWAAGGVSIEDTSTNVAAALGPDFLALPFEEAIKLLPQLAAKYLPQFKGQFKDTADEVITDADKIAKANEQASDNYAKSWIGRNEKILESFKTLFSELNDLFQNITDNRLKQIKEQTDAELEALTIREDANKEQLDNKAISERDFLEEQTRIEEERLRVQEDAAAREKELQRQQFAAQQAIAIFEIGLATAKSLATINGQIAAYQAGLPVTAPLLANAQLSRILLLATSAAQVAAVLAQPKPFRLGSKDTGPQDQMARVGEEGEEIVFMPRGSKVLPNRQTRKYGEVLDAMFDNNLDKYVLNNYVTPALMAQKQKYESEKSRSFADNISKSIYFNGLNAGDMERIRKKGQHITNVDELADAIAKRIPTRDIYR
jgi:hypothetical protein